jgi:hypothetical protein
VNDTRRQLARARYLRERSVEHPVFVRRLGVAVPTAVVLMLGWAAFVIPGGARWAGAVWLGALAVLVIGTATLLIGSLRTPWVVDVRSAPGTGTTGSRLAPPQLSRGPRR